MCELRITITHLLVVGAVVLGKINLQASRLALVLISDPQSSVEFMKELLTAHAVKITFILTKLWASGEKTRLKRHPRVEVWIKPTAECLTVPFFN